MEYQPYRESDYLLSVKNTKKDKKGCLLCQSILAILGCSFTHVQQLKITSMEKKIARVSCLHMDVQVHRQISS